MTALVLSSNRLQDEDAAVHGWYRFVLSFPPHIVRTYLERFRITQDQLVLDPFCGTGTTLVECKKLGIAAGGVEANPMAHFASRIKTDWGMRGADVRRFADGVASVAFDTLEHDGLQSLPLLATPTPHIPELLQLEPEEEKLLLAESISPLPLHKSLLLRNLIALNTDGRLRNYGLLALARTLVETAGNLHFGPEVGVGRRKVDAPVVEAWLANMETIAADLDSMQQVPPAPTGVHHHDARSIDGLFRPSSVGFVFTSPPYPNEKDYTRTTRLESVILGFIKSRSELRLLKKTLVSSNTRTVYKDGRDDDQVIENGRVQALASEIEERRRQLGKTSGFERLYARATKLYFGGMKRHLAQLRPCLKPGAHLCYVVGDQASYFQVMIRTGELLAEIAESLGYEVVGIDLFRTRLATATREQLREEVVVLRWPGSATP